MRTQIEILLGTLLVFISGIMLLMYGANEETRMKQYEAEQRGRAIEIGAGLYENNCSGCHGKQGEGIPGLCPPLNDKYFFTDRLRDVGWSGAQEDYIIATISSGRLASTRPEQYPGQGKPAMPAWSDRYAGPLREDQVRDIATFIMNWRDKAPDRGAAPVLDGPAVGTDIAQVLPAGDAAKGEALAVSQGCAGCHISTNSGPAWNATGSEPGIGTRAAARFGQSDYTGKATTAEQYLLESIVQPAAFVLPGFAVQMPNNYGAGMTVQNAADLIAYLLTLK